MTSTIINLDDFRKERETETSIEVRLKALKDGVKDILKSIESMEEYFKKHPFDINVTKKD